MKDIVETVGDSRKLILEVMMAVKEGAMPADRATCVIEGMEAINKSIQVEVNAAKMSLMAAAAGKDFGEVVRLGQRKIFGGELLEEPK